MKRILIVLMVCFVFTTVQAQMDNPLKEGMLNTVKLSTGEVIYDLKGEWEAVYHNNYFGSRNDIVKVTQKGNEFVGTNLIGNEIVPKGDAIKGQLHKGGFKSVLSWLHGMRWATSTGEIGEKCDKIVIKTRDASGGAALILTLTRK